jgi:GntR family transcriptional regulator
VNQKVKFFKVDVSSGIPLYLQLKEEIKKAFFQGFFSPGEKLPPVREMALSLKVNPNTVARAYQELEKEGYVSSRIGKGTFFKKSSLKEKEKLKLLQPHLFSFLAEAKKLSFEKSEILDLLQKYWEGGEDDSH